MSTSTGNKLQPKADETFLDSIGNKIVLGDPIIDCLSRSAGMFIRISRRTQYGVEMETYHWIRFSNWVVQTILNKGQKSVITISNMSGDYNFIKLFYDEMREGDRYLYDKIKLVLKESPEFYNIRYKTRKQKFETSEC